MANTAQLVRYAITAGVLDPDQPTAIAGRPRFQVLTFQGRTPAAPPDPTNTVDRLVNKLRLVLTYTPAAARTLEHDLDPLFQLEHCQTRSSMQPQPDTPKAFQVKRHHHLLARAGRQ